MKARTQAISAGLEFTDAVWCADEHEVGVRVYGDLAGGQAALVWAHGGSWTGGSVEEWHPILARLHSSVGSAIVGVRYRLASQVQHPEPVRDLVTAVTVAKCLVGDNGRVVIGGDSAGGTLAASTALVVSNLLAGQVLLYPPMDPLCTAPELRRPGVFPDFWHMKQSWAQYAGHGAASVRWGHPDNADRALSIPVSPLHARVPRDVPPATLIVGSRDPLCSDVQRYATHLRAAGAHARCHVLSGVQHADFLRPEEPRTRELHSTIVSESRRLLAESPKEGSFS